MKNINSIILKCINISNFLEEKLSSVSEKITYSIQTFQEIKKFMNVFINRQTFSNFEEFYFLSNKIYTTLKNYKEWIHSFSGDEILVTEIKLQILDFDIEISIQLKQMEDLFLSQTKSLKCTLAQNIWDTNFGNKIMIDYEQFVKVFNSYLDEFVIRQIDCANDGYISIFEFNIFLMCFGSISQCNKNFNDAKFQKIFVGYISRFRADYMLKGKCKGSFLIRYSKNNPGCLDIAFVREKEKIQHLLVRPFTLGCYIFEPYKNIYTSLIKFIEVFNYILKFPCNKI